MTVVDPAPLSLSSVASTFTVYSLPSITSLSPSHLPVQSAGVQLTVSGQNFQPGAVVLVGSTALPTIPQSAAQLVATIPAGLLNAIGSLPVTVVNPAPFAGTSASSNFTADPLSITLAAITPVTALAGAAAFTLQVQGSGFSPATVIRFNGVPVATTFTDDKTLTGIVSPDLIRQPRVSPSM